ncbi:chemotaxis protein CheX [Helicobacter turcicus]|uniref:Chemotaxis protein CheX n=1 Tax=Helicobacter turcicus TaxID=2867412 RepID=A0ABS7JP40_9HELI|nr:chemotaxis protein CheX [Helicobacter turcicus]MBX7491132.1 chemotaxis protein CheX [Helicobacter turcicus]MBX7545996.1 chemotaxis protein CheX [Helicobacter turcicus]
MRPIIKHDIAIYAPDVHLDMKAAKEICQVLISNSATIRSLALKAVYFSFENIHEFDEGATILIAKALLAMQNKVSVAVAFVDYNDEQFPKLKTLFPNKSLPLFRTENMANLLLGLKTPPLNQTIVYYDKDSMVQTLISQELISKGYQVICINSSSEFINKRRQLLDKAIYLYDIYFDITNNFIPITIANGIVTYTLYKKVDKNIALFFNIQAHNSRLREGYKIFIFDASETKEFNLSVLDFIMSLALNNTRFESCIAICGLKANLDTDKQNLCARSNILFFHSIEECKKNPKIQELAKSYQTAGQKRKGLTKQLVAQLPVFINAAIETLSSLTGGSAKRTDYKVTPYNKTSQTDVMGAMIKFEGDVSGLVALCFSKSIVKEASMMLLGEESQSDEELLDVISEFTNIIAGRSKAVLSEHNVSIGISLPKAYKSEEEIAITLSDKQGVQVNLLLNDKPLVLFLAH